MLYLNPQSSIAYRQDAPAPYRFHASRERPWRRSRRMRSATLAASSATAPPSPVVRFLVA